MSTTTSIPFKINPKAPKLDLQLYEQMSEAIAESQNEAQQTPVRGNPKNVFFYKGKYIAVVINDTDIMVGTWDKKGGYEYGTLPQNILETLNTYIIAICAHKKSMGAQNCARWEELLVQSGVSAATFLPDSVTNTRPAQTRQAPPFSRGVFSK